MKSNLFKGVGFSVLLLGVASLLVDISSEMILSILPLFIVSLGGTGIIVGLIGGVGDSIANLLNVFSGYWSDRTGKRKIFVFSGYTVSAFSKILLAFSLIWQHILILRSLERTGKGIRTAPRDAIISESKKRGKAFGIHRAMDTSGAVIGSGIAFLFLFVFIAPSPLHQYKTIILLASIPAFCALVPLLFIHEKKKMKTETRISFRNLPKKFYLSLTAMFVFSIGNFTYMFFLLKANLVLSVYGFRNTAALTVLLYVFFNIVYAFFAVPSGMLSDKIGRKKVVVTGYLVFGLTCAGFASFNSLLALIILFALYGVFYAIIEGNQRAFASDFAPENLRASALGAFHTLIGIGALTGSVIAGILWTCISSSTAFVFGAGMAFVAVGMLGMLR
ncbi:MAG: MFS transporter [Thermoplasmatales archaeon]|nr:MFS transporter [Thermoplasmatales archaeon]